MKLPIQYSIRNVAVRKGSTALTALGIALTVAVFSGIFALREGLKAIYRPMGSDQLAVYLRQGSTSEGESGIPRGTMEILVKERPELVRDGSGNPIAAAEMYLAVFRPKVDGGRTNVPIRGVAPQSIALHGERLRMVEGRQIRFGTDEVMVGLPLSTRIENCRLGDELELNVRKFKVVGIYELEGAQGGEIWGDVNRMMDALQRPVFQRVIAQVPEGTDFEQVQKELDADPRLSITVTSERDYLSRQTGGLGALFSGLGAIVTFIMGIAAIFGAMNTMLAAVGSRTQEIGILLAIGYPRMSIFTAFMIESATIGLIGGVLGVLLVLPINGIQTGAMNYNTFTDVTFAFRVTPEWQLYAVIVAVALGVIGGFIPAAIAAFRRPVDALRRG